MTQQEVASASTEQAYMRSIVPLVRRIQAETFDRHMEIEFEVLPQADDPEPPVFIGLRVGGANPTEAAEAGDRLRDAGIAAKVHLYRLGGPTPEPVALSRSRWSSRSEVQTVPVGEDGEVPELFATNADFLSMRDAGLLQPNVDYKEFEFVFIRDIHPGTYRAVVELTDVRRASHADNPEVLIAYTARSK